MAVVEFDVRHDQLPISLAKACERRAITPLCLARHGGVERRGAGSDKRVRQGKRHSPARRATVLVTDTVAHRLAQIRRKSVSALRLECVQTCQRAHDGVLYEIGRVGRGAGPLRKTAVRPSAELRKTAADELPQRARIASAGAGEETPRRRRMHARGRGRP